MRYLRRIAMARGAFENAMNGFFERLLLDLKRYRFTIPKFLQPLRTVAAEANVLCDRLRGERDRRLQDQEESTSHKPHESSHAQEVGTGSYLVGFIVYPR